MNSSNKRRSRAKAQSNCVQNREIKKKSKNLQLCDHAVQLVISTVIKHEKLNMQNLQVLLIKI